MNAYNNTYSLEKEALLASGANKDYRISDYADKLDYLFKQFISEIMPENNVIKNAKNLFKWLWKKKPFRYKPGGSFNLCDVIDNQINKSAVNVGNCLGLTLLYNCLLKKMDIQAKALYLENGFGIGPHVLTVLLTKQLTIDVENILSDGFDYKKHLCNLHRIKWEDRELVSDIYHSAGNKAFIRKEYEKALFCYDMAIKLYPKYKKARLNKMILLEIIRGQSSK